MRPVLGLRRLLLLVAHRFPQCVLLPDLGATTEVDRKWGGCEWHRLRAIGRETDGFVKVRHLYCILYACVCTKIMSRYLMLHRIDKFGSCHLCTLGCPHRKFLFLLAQLRRRIRCWFFFDLCWEGCTNPIAKISRASLQTQWVSRRVVLPDHQKSLFGSSMTIDIPTYKTQTDPKVKISQ